MRNCLNRVAHLKARKEVSKIHELVSSKMALSSFPPFASAAMANSSYEVSAGLLSDASFLSTLVASFFVIICSELGDKTFMITGLLAMKEGNALYVFCGSIAALWLMTGLSAVGGVLLPALLSPEIIHWLMIAMLAVFGVKMLVEGFSADFGDTSEELSRLERELALKKETDDSNEMRPQGPSTQSDSALSTHTEGEGPQNRHAPPSAADASDEAASPLKASSSSGRVLHRDGSQESGSTLWGRTSSVLYASLASFLSPVFLQSFGLTFVAEWGDRSQISTFALAADRSVVGVFLGAALGHALCTALAVLGGKVLASRISERVVLLTGGVMFVLFAIFGAVLDL
ncbi:putative membrane protein C17G8.08c [Toxoplasma gondii TgCatPRC2]|uniref:Divalent cation/proton antiporter CAXL1 n=5 Tax=Toxoplasma gondii TaxID=5811 RepID=CAXL1_TOXGM|nr:membrane protein C17G8.08c, putative [Toxoplasma gondii ME49]EPR58133.1 putative membrane protein C17G8.08c [Toxoplasma gondii GT1]KAF4644941.1 putative membrane protein C17G8.08c [Toxoplasma gondii]KYF39117.1 putative membrane protein C17G8.08c [Toxoplasma gondii ARI]KYK66871.1 putative membrane protein C17G8.08c [Toxoplasma gondii TgCatPRC2]EPT31505.1 membrane protein C17G8.08c, putative [Toxoplasma gondii ME49]|eukprot:XP_002369832.2 membrane protein C17G8.08c, putative [Toxoplasma gondii ME49]